MDSGHIRLGENATIGNLQLMVIDDENIQLLSEDRYTILEVHFSTSTKVAITFLRGIALDSNNPHRSRQASPYFDEIILNPNDADISAITSCLDVIHKEIPPLVSRHLSEGGQDVVDFLQMEINRPSEQYQVMLSGLAGERSEFRKFVDDSRGRTNEEYEETKRRSIAENYERKQEFEIYREKEEGDLQERKNELEEKEQKIDNRQHMHARRELRQQITENLKKRLQEPIVSRKSSNMRILVFLLTLAVGLAIGFFGILSFGELVAVENKNGFPEWLLIVWVLRGIVLIVLAAGFIAYAINWLRAIYLDDVRAHIAQRPDHLGDALGIVTQDMAVCLEPAGVYRMVGGCPEQRYERYGNDIDRASFVIETIMEVGEKEGLEVPDTWIDGVCRNLFSDKNGREDGGVAANPAAMLLQSISGAKFGPGGAEVTMSRRDARRLSKNIPDC